MLAELVPLVLLSPVLVATGYSDLRRMRIPNALSLAALALFAVSAPFLMPLEAIALRAAIAAGVLCLGFLMFAFGLVGAGDVKIFSALLLFVPTPTMSVFLFVFSVAMILGMALMPVLRALPNAAQTGWVALERDAKFPMGISIAMAGLAHPVVVFALIG